MPFLMDKSSKLYHYIFWVYLLSNLVFFLCKKRLKKPNFLISFHQFIVLKHYKRKNSNIILLRSIFLNNTIIVIFMENKKKYTFYILRSVNDMTLS